VTWRIELADLCVELWRTSSIVHVPEMVFAFHVVNVILDQLVSIGKLEDDGKEAEELIHDFFVALPAEILDLLDVVLQNGRLNTLVVSIEFGKIVDLDVVDDRFRESERSADSWVLFAKQITHTV
jgi:hypothetical protein